MKAKLVACLAAMVTGSIAVASPPVQAEPLATVAVGAVGSGSANNWPIYIAMSEGFLKKDGIALNFIGIPASSAVQQQLAAGSLNIGTGGIVDPLRAIDKGAPITLLRIQVAKGTYAMLAKPSIHSMAELKGKTVSIGGLRDITHYYFDRMAKAAGLDPASCNLIYAGATSLRLAGLLSGSVDATMLNTPYLFVAEAKGFKELPVDPNYDKGLPFTGFSVNINWAEHNKPLVRKFLDAYDKAVAWFYDPSHREQALTILLSKVKVTRSEAEKTYDLYVKDKFFVTKSTIDKGDLQDEIDVLKQDGSLSGSTDFSRFYKPQLLGLSK